MATPADQRLLELLGKWLASLELHAKYASLDDDSYSAIQPWPAHQRPSRWIIDLATQKALALRAQLEDRIEARDAKFSDSLELMIFLANLVGSEHIERFIPLAEIASERVVVADPTVEQPIAIPEPAAAAATTGTREMPKFLVAESRARASAAPAHGIAANHPAQYAAARVARTERKAPDTDTQADEPAPKVAGKTQAKAVAPNRAPAPGKAAAPGRATTPGKPIAPAAKPAVKAGAAKPLAPALAAAAAAVAASTGTHDRNASSAEAREQVIADAVRLVQWGRKWYELAELISSMAARPHITDVRRILKDNKAVIDKRAGRG